MPQTLFASRVPIWIKPHAPLPVRNRQPAIQELKEGINRTAREVHVAWDDLKRRMAPMGEVPQQPGSPAFVELVAPRAESIPECMVELEGRRCKVRIQLKGASASYLATLSRELWESAS